MHLRCCDAFFIIQRFKRWPWSQWSFWGPRALVWLQTLFKAQGTFQNLFQLWLTSWSPIAEIPEGYVAGSHYPKYEIWTIEFFGEGVISFQKQKVTSDYNYIDYTGQAKCRCKNIDKSGADLANNVNLVAATATTIFIIAFPWHNFNVEKGGGKIGNSVFPNRLFVVALSSCNKKTMGVSSPRRLEHLSQVSILGRRGIPQYALPSSVSLSLLRKTHDDRGNSLVASGRKKFSNCRQQFPRFCLDRLFRIYQSPLLNSLPGSGRQAREKFYQLTFDKVLLCSGFQNRPLQHLVLFDRKEKRRGGKFFSETVKGKSFVATANNFQGSALPSLPEYASLGSSVDCD